MPQQLQADLKAKMEAAGIPVPDSEERWGLALQALKVRSLAVAVQSTNYKSYSIDPAAGIPVPDSEERWRLALEALKVRPKFRNPILQPLLLQNHVW